MPTLSIKNVPNALLDELRGRGARHHRSIQGELMALLTAAVEPANARVALDAPGSLERATGRRTGTRRIDKIAAEHRKRWKSRSAKCREPWI